jgi:hypothetical protein
MKRAITQLFGAENGRGIIHDLWEDNFCAIEPALQFEWKRARPFCGSRAERNRCSGNLPPSVWTLVCCVDGTRDCWVLVPGLQVVSSFSYILFIRAHVYSLRSVSLHAPCLYISCLRTHVLIYPELEAAVPCTHRDTHTSSELHTI